MLTQNQTPDDPLAVCNSLLLGNERRQMVRAAHFAHAGSHGDAERLRESLGYGAADCRHDVNKIGNARQ